MNEDAAGKRLPEGEVLRINDWEAAMTFFLGAAGVLVGVGVLLSGHGRNDVPSWFAPATGLLCIALGVHIAARSRRGLIVRRDGIAVQGAFRQRHWIWVQIREFELTNAIYGPCLKIVFTDAKQIRVPGFKTRSRDQRELAEARVAELNRRVAETRLT